MVLCVVSTLKSLNLFNGSTSSQEITFVMSESLKQSPCLSKYDAIEKIQNVCLS